MWAASDIADWWDEEHKRNKKIVDRFVDRNPNLFGVIAGTWMISSSELVGELLDPLRFGEGAAEGGIGGFAKDGLRLLGFTGPAGKALKYARLIKMPRLARLIADPGGDICGWIATTIAATHTGARVFASVDDLAKAIGRSLSTLGASSLRENAAVLRAVGALTGPIEQMKSLADVARLLKPDGSVVQFTVMAYRRGQVAGTHVLVAFRDALGRMKILDRGLEPGKLPQVVNTLEDLTSKYGLDRTMVVLGGFPVSNAFVKIVDGIANLAIAAFLSTTGLTHEENETIVQAYTVHKKVDEGGSQALQTPQARHHTVVAGDWLSKIARTYYGNMHKWPVIYSANWGTIGKNPDLIKPGQKLLIPELPAVGNIGTMK